MRTSARLLIGAALAITIAACDAGGSKTEGAHRGSAEDSDVLWPREAAAATAVVEHVRPGRKKGFDPDVWKSVENKASVLPNDARLQVAAGSFVGDDRSATVDAVLSRAGRSDQTVWVFLRKVDHAWLIYGTLPLGGPTP